MMKTLFLALMAVLTLTACGETTIDASSVDTFESSVEAMAEDPNVDPHDLVSAIGVIESDASKRGRARYNPNDSKEDRAEDLAAFRDRIDGMTAKEILAEAEALKKAWAERPTPEWKKKLLENKD